MVKKYSEKEILEFLRETAIMSIAVSSSDKPISSIVLFAVDDDFTFYFATHESSYKAKTLMQNPKISMSIWEHFKMLVQIDGVAKPVEEDKIDEVLDKLAKSTLEVADFWPPIFRVKDDYYTVFEIKPTWLRALDLTSLAMREEESPFTELNFGIEE